MKFIELLIFLKHVVAHSFLFENKCTDLIYIQGLAPFCSLYLGAYIIVFTYFPKDGPKITPQIGEYER